jgi:hypothetical protein
MNRPIVIVIIVCVLFGGIYFLISIRGFLPLPMGLRHILNPMLAGKDLYQPVISDTFHFYQQGFTKTFEFKPKYMDFYEIGFSVGDKGIDSNYKFVGKVKTEFFSKNRLIHEETMTSIQEGLYEGKDMKHYRQVSLLKFKVPIQDMYIEDLRIKLSVIEADEYLHRFGDKLRFYVAVSAAP